MNIYILMLIYQITIHKYIHYTRPYVHFFTKGISLKENDYWWQNNKNKWDRA